MLAGYVLAQIQREAKSNALDELMKQMSNMEIIQFLFGKSPDAKTLRGFSKDWITKNKVSLDLDTLMKEFNNREISSLPYSYAKDVTGQTTQFLINSEKNQKKLENQVWTIVLGLLYRPFAVGDHRHSWQRNNIYFVPNIRSPASPNPGTM